MEALNFYNISTDMFVPKPEEHVLRPSAPAWKVQMWDFFEDSASSIGARSFSIVSLLVVVIASVFFVLETMPEFGSRAAHTVASLRASRPQASLSSRPNTSRVLPARLSPGPLCLVSSISSTSLPSFRFTSRLCSAAQGVLVSCGWCD